MLWQQRRQKLKWSRASANAAWPCSPPSLSAGTRMPHLPMPVKCVHLQTIPFAFVSPCSWSGQVYIAGMRSGCSGQLPGPRLRIWNALLQQLELTCA